jgi:hypothetical protein
VGFIDKALEKAKAKKKNGGIQAFVPPLRCHVDFRWIAFPSELLLT